MSAVNDGLSSDFFAKQRPRLQPMTNEEYRNATKRDQDPRPNSARSLCEDRKALRAMSPAEKLRYCGKRDHQFDGLDPDAGEANG